MSNLSLFDDAMSQPAVVSAIGKPASPGMEAASPAPVLNDVDQSRPLAWRMRPKSLDDYVGQTHLTGPGKPLRKMVDAGALHSCVLWGPPGVGKTTLAEILATSCNARFVQMSAVMVGVKEIREAAEQATVFRGQKRRTVLFLDEIHRLNKTQQDALLPHVESGLLTLVCATTQNPSFEIVGALLSRARVYVLNPLSEDDLVVVLRRAIDDPVRGLGQRKLHVGEDALSLIARCSAGDARRALGLLETAADMAHEENGIDVLDVAAVQSIAGRYAGRIDRDGDVHYDLLSALHKSVRSSRPQAALLYMARYTVAGGDPLDIIRRLTAIASEDVGAADPTALPLVISAWDAYLRLGQYEGERAIAQALVHLCTAPKSNAVDKAWNSAKAFVEAHPGLEPPLYIRNAPTKLMAELRYKQGYRYAHDEPDGYPAGESHNCWPEEVPEQDFYRPTTRGQESVNSQVMRARQALDR